MSEPVLSLLGEENRVTAVPAVPRTGLRHSLALALEVVSSGLTELWAHKMRSILTLTLLMLGVFALVVMTSVLDGIMDKISTGFAGMSWDGTVVIRQKSPETSEEQKRFAMSPGLRMEDVPRLTAPYPSVLAFMPRASKQVSVRVAGGTERIFVTGNVPDWIPVMNRRIASGRGLTEDDQRRRSTVAVLGASLASKVLGGADPVGKDILVDGIPFRVVGVLAPLMIFNEDTWMDANGMLVPLEAYMDRLDATHKLSQLSVKLKSKSDLKDVSALLVGRAKQAHHGIRDVEIVDLEAEAARSWQNFMNQMHGWTVVLLSLAGTVLLVGGVGVLSVMLISFSDRRYEIGLRKALGATDKEIFVQFLLEAAVLAALGALAGTLAGAGLCKALGANFPYGLVVNPYGLIMAWVVALALSLVFGLYPAFRAMRLSPMEAMR
ncbi:ABC transporter permease [Mesoterricola sediminis]|uniref:ABC transporter permease n=1 Tax=Mesoterricola sediminis TaxID=2927980 RepID=A0AA48GUI1_9BACT|nr:ABC transporter permease [Mesoterricola sediminis]BDU75880.1 ABC transporter permease [Mesoterricola sediminis]